MRLLFYYVQHRQALKYFDFLKTEGYFSLLKRMVKTKIVDEVLVLIDSSQEVKPFKMYNKIIGQTVNEINLEPVGGIRKDDIIWVRGGWRSWHDFLVKRKEIGNKLLLYAANTGRQRWPFWDVIFDDILGKDIIDKAGRQHVDFRKPTNTNIFYPNDKAKIYDLCIGASNIHDKKGQWRVIKALIEYKKMFGENLSCIMPGSLQHGVKTNEILNDIKKHELNVIAPGNVPREVLSDIYNSSKVFVHFGSSGQGDRGVLEAIACGCPVIIGFPKCHSPVLTDNFVTVIPDIENFKMIALILKSEIDLSNDLKRKQVYDFHLNEFDLDGIILPEMKKLFEVLKK